MAVTLVYIDNDITSTTRHTTNSSVCYVAFASLYVTVCLLPWLLENLICVVVALGGTDIHMYIAGFLSCCRFQHLTSIDTTQHQSPGQRQLYIYIPNPLAQ
jgi:hypothetical protein